MVFFARYLLTAILCLPALGAVVLWIFHRRRAARWIALSTTILTFALSLSFLLIYDWHTPANHIQSACACRDAAHPAGVVQFVQRVNLIRTLGIQYFVGVDGLSLPLVILTAFIFIRVCVACWKTHLSLSTAPNTSESASISSGSQEFAIYLLLESTLLGAFLSLNLLFFLFFFSTSIVAIAVLLRGTLLPENRAVLHRFIAAMTLGALLLIAAIIAIYCHARSFDLIALPTILRPKFSAGAPTFHVGQAIYVTLMAAFLMRLPVVPLHRWLCEVYRGAPMPLGLVVSALLLSTGAYGILRIAWPLFPDAGRSLWLIFAILGLVNILYGALAIMAQKTLGQVVAYISICEMGFVLLGTAMMTPAGLNGATIMLIAQGLLNALLLGLAGMLVSRTGNDCLPNLRALMRNMPVFNGFLIAGVLCGMGLPTSGVFIGQLLVLAGTFSAAGPGSIVATGGWQSVNSVYAVAIAACIGTLLLAVALVWKSHALFFCSADNEAYDFSDMNQHEATLLTPLLVAVLIIGILPIPFYFAFTRTTLDALWRCSLLR